MYCRGPSETRLFVASHFCSVSAERRQRQEGQTQILAINLIWTVPPFKFKEELLGKLRLGFQRQPRSDLGAQLENIEKISKLGHSTLLPWVIVIARAEGQANGSRGVIDYFDAQRRLYPPTESRRNLAKYVINGGKSCWINKKLILCLRWNSRWEIYPPKVTKAQKFRGW